MQFDFTKLIHMIVDRGLSTPKLLQLGQSIHCLHNLQDKKTNVGIKKQSYNKTLIV